MNHKIVILCGRSASGKDFIYKKLIKSGFVGLVTNTTRPQRVNEIDSVDYNFLSQNHFFDLINNGDMIEYRKYNTEFGVWYYGSSAENVNLDKHDYVIILTLDGAEAWINHFGAENCIVFYIDCPKYIREQRAKERGSFNREEWERRLKADKLDFPMERIAKLCNFKIANYNRPIHEIIGEIKQDISFWKDGK